MNSGKSSGSNSPPSSLSMTYFMAIEPSCSRRGSHQGSAIQGLVVKGAKELPRAELGRTFYLMQPSVSRDQPLLDQRRIHPKPQSLSRILDLHFGMALHRQEPLEQSGAEALMLWLTNGRTPELSPFQMELPGTFGLVHVPPNLDVSSRNRQSPVPDGIGGQFVKGHANRN